MDGSQSAKLKFGKSNSLTNETENKVTDERITALHKIVLIIKSTSPSK